MYQHTNRPGIIGAVGIVYHQVQGGKNISVGTGIKT